MKDFEENKEGLEVKKEKLAHIDSNSLDYVSNREFEDSTDKINDKKILSNNSSDFLKDNYLVIIFIAIVLFWVSLPFFNFKGDRYGEDRAMESNMKTELGHMRVQADFYYLENNRSYKDFCAKSNMSIENLHGWISDSFDEVGCKDDHDQWVAWVKMKSNDNYWCVDYVGFFEEVTNRPLVMKCL